MPTIDAAGTITVSNDEMYQVSFAPNGTKPVFVAHRDVNGHVQISGEPLFNAMHIWNADDAAERIVACARLRLKRQAKGWDQAKMADALGISRVHYNRMEMGKEPVAPRTAKMLALI